MEINPKVIAVYWTFNPDVKILSLSLKKLINYVDEVIIVDNASRNIDQLRELILKISNKDIRIIELKRNLDVKALNIGISEAIKKRADWVLLMDDDSIYPGSTLRKIMIANNILCRHRNDLCYKIAIISLPTWMYKESKSTFIIYNYAWQFSGSLVKTDIVKKHGTFIPENFFVDLADVFFYSMVRKIGYITIHYTRDKMLHKSGRIILLPRLLKPWKKRA